MTRPVDASRRAFLLGGFFRTPHAARRPGESANGAAIIAARAPAARILVEHCLAHQGTFCSVCVEHCPEPGAIASERGRPMVVAQRCTGCALCAEVCPAPHGGAIAALRPGAAPRRRRE